jgi:phospholipase/carboxylesterase
LAEVQVKSGPKKLSGSPVAAQEALLRAGGDVTLDIVEDLGHAIDDRSMQFALDHLRFTVPKHYFDEALSGGKPNDDDIVEFL